MNPSGLTPTQTSQIRQNIGVLGNKNSSEDAKNEAIKSLKQNVGSIRGQLVLMTQDEQKTTLGELYSILDFNNDQLIYLKILIQRNNCQNT